MSGRVSWSLPSSSSSIFGSGGGCINPSSFKMKADCTGNPPNFLALLRVIIITRGDVGGGLSVILESPPGDSKVNKLGGIYA